MFTQDHQDWRNLEEGRIMPSELYTDQPYFIKTGDGAWLCCVTTGPGSEGRPGQHVITMRSRDQGRTWEDRNELESTDDPESAYGVLLKVPSGRIFAFYNYNEDNLRGVIADPGPPFYGTSWRVDCQGYFVFRYSDDHGVTWSAARYKIPVRLMDIDRRNPYQGRIRFFWNVGKAFLYEGAAYVPLIKVGNFGFDCYTRTEGVLLRCDNILEPDVTKLHWETLPEGDFGIRPVAGGGAIAEEQSYMVLSDGSFFVVFRTIDGHPACAYSRDRGRSWSESRYMRFDRGGLMRHPRAANFIWKYDEGKYLYWFHNHGGQGYQDRNPAWVCPGVEADSPEGKVIRWGQPEILLYDPDPRIAMSYPDLLIDNGVFVSETQKKTGRIHRIDEDFLQRMFQAFDCPSPVTDHVLYEGPGPKLPVLELPTFAEKEHQLQIIGTRRLTAGFSLEFGLQPGAAGILLDNRDGRGRGLMVAVKEDGALRLELSDGQCDCFAESNPGTVAADRKTHAVITVDGAAAIIMMVIDGVLCDGGERQFGWRRLHPGFSSPNTAVPWKLSADVKLFRVYGRALMTAEAGMSAAFFHQAEEA